MPLYEYLCKRCGAKHEIIQKFIDDPLKKCPLCKSKKIMKQLSPTNFQFKGGSCSGGSCRLR